MNTPRKARDYAGLAALITAIGGVVAMWVSQSQHREQSTQVQDSVLAVLQYRLTEVEGHSAAISEELNGLRIDLMRQLGPGMAPRATESPVKALDEFPPHPRSPKLAGAPGRALSGVVRKVQGKGPVGAQELNDLVQSIGRPLSAEDLGEL